MASKTIWAGSTVAIYFATRAYAKLLRVCPVVNVGMLPYSVRVPLNALIAEDLFVWKPGQLALPVLACSRVCMHVRTPCTNVTPTSEASIYWFHTSGEMLFG